MGGKGSPPCVGKGPQMVNPALVPDRAAAAHHMHTRRSS